MSKKEYVIKLLTALQADWPLARWLLALIEQNKVDDQSIDALSKIFIDAVNKVSTKVNEQKIHKAGQLLQKIKLIEWGQDNDLGNLEDQINAL